MKHDRDIYTALFIALCVLAMIAGASIALLFIPSASAETLVCIAPEGQYVNVRKAPRSDAGVWGRLHAGDEIDAKGVESGFIRFVYGGSRAYVSVKLFEIPADCRYVVAADGRVRVRSAPGGDRVAWAEPGDAVQVDAWRYDASGSLWARSGERYIAASCLVPETGEGAR